MNTVFFDLDATLLPMNQDRFLVSYYNGLERAMSCFFDAPGSFRSALMRSIVEVLNNDGTMTNELRFIKTFTKVSGLEFSEMEGRLYEYYLNEFDNLDGVLQPDPYAAACVRTLREKGYTTVLATNPVFPRVATLKRISWAGLWKEDFDHITTYENSSFCKPNLKYYEEILHIIDRRPSDCLMVGNDVRDDMPVTALGMKTFLLDTYLINAENADLTQFCSGNTEKLLSFIRALPCVEKQVIP